MMEYKRVKNGWLEDQGIHIVKPIVKTYQNITVAQVEEALEGLFDLNIDYTAGIDPYASTDQVSNSPITSVRMDLLNMSEESILTRLDEISEEE